MIFTPAFVVACIWLVIANVLAMIPSRDNHWQRAYVLMGFGLPITVGLAVQNGVWIAVVFLLAGLWILRWPVIYLARWVRRVSGLDG